ncbi:MAG: hypothetical protein MJ203_05735 [archaeon]|nr:hypothetical protein [archaeon]
MKLKNTKTCDDKKCKKCAAGPDTWAYLVKALKEIFNQVEIIDPSCDEDTSSDNATTSDNDTIQPTIENATNGTEDAPEAPPEEDACPDAPLKKGIYKIKASNSSLFLEFLDGKLIINNENDTDTQKFNFNYTSDCNGYYISNGDKYLAPVNISSDADASPNDTASPSPNGTEAAPGPEASESVKSTPFDLLFIIDSTGSMANTLAAVKTYTLTIAGELGKELKEYDFKYGAVYYQDPVERSGKNSKFDFTSDMNAFQKYINSQVASGGAGLPEDWVGAYTLAKTLSWRDGIKLIIHIADASAHGTNYTGGIDDSEYNAEAEKMDKLTIDFCDMKQLYIKGFTIPWDKKYKVPSADLSFKRMNELCKEHRNKQLFINLVDIKKFDQNNKDPTYFTNMVVNSTKEVAKESKEVDDIITATDFDGSSTSQQWKVEFDGTTYTISNPGKDGKVASVKDGLLQNGTLIIFGNKTGAEYEKFLITDATDNTTASA